MAIFAYMRVSTDKMQTTDNQRKDITDAGFAVPEENWYSEDGVSGSVEAMKRPQFVAMMNRLLPGDTCIVTMLDRLGRDNEDILHTMNHFQRTGMKLRIMQFDGLDICSATGKLVASVMAAVAEMERNLIRERTKSGMARVKAQGTKLGQPLKIAPDVLEAAIQDKEAGHTLEQISTRHSVARNTLARNITKWSGKTSEYRTEYTARQSQYAVSLASRGAM